MTSGSKTTAYVEGYNSDGLQYEQDLINVGAKFVKIENADQRAKTVLANSNLMVFYRDIARLEEPFNNTYGVGDPIALAGDWFTRFMGIMGTVPQTQRGRLFTSGAFNEPGDLENNDKLAWYAAFEKRRMELLQPTGFKAAIFAFSAEGRIADGKWPALLPAITYAIANGHKYDSHGYNAKSMFDQGVGGNDVNLFLFNHLPLCQQLEAAGLVIPNGFFWYGEWSIDLIFYPGNSGNPAKPYSGWLTTGCTAEEYVTQLSQADTVLMADRRVLGAAVYIWHNSPGMHTNYNIRFARQTRPGQFELPTAGERLLTYIASVPDTQPPPEPPVPPTPTPGAGKYRVKAQNIRSAPDLQSADLGDWTPNAIVDVEYVTPEVIDGYHWARVPVWVAYELLEKV